MDDSAAEIVFAVHCGIVGSAHENVHYGHHMFQTPFKMAVPSNSALFESIGGDFGYSLCLLLKCSHGKNYRALDCVFFGYFYNVPQPPKVYIGK